ncbi:aminotransferase class III-fold pyridoxal phosphate-dependent enzyme [Actinomadura madurae]|uniref:aminotransferase class III-fold pyridoxal phosphate-dependent enzyme n=1 Tax=Actinomadura madurae TaxID=1993 RepID=UPI0020D23174|nr:aminotransferase class III-fold pyridoxal phosphate-dependent enzyme [Actinomadura madurae]
MLPPGYLAPIFAAAAERGVLTIADEVQVGFGRLGEAFWGFQTQSVVPDFVTMGKAMGNGFPMAALVTTREISQAFDNAGRFFSTYGGNPVACAVGLELLDIVQDEALQHNALVVGEYLRDKLGALASPAPADRRCSRAGPLQWGRIRARPRHQGGGRRRDVDDL